VYSVFKTSIKEKGTITQPFTVFAGPTGSPEKQYLPLPTAETASPLWWYFSKLIVLYVLEVTDKSVDYLRD
jgi:hypothetical protein